MIPRLLPVLLLFTAHAHAGLFFVSSLSGANYNPPNGSNAYGTGTLSISDDQTFLTATLAMSNLNSLPTLAGIFGPRSQSGFSPIFLSLPLLSNGPSSYFGSASTSVTPQFVSDLRSGSYFFNVFTEAYPSGVLVQSSPPPLGGGPSQSQPPVYSGGEASGDISETPEPSTTLLLAVGALVLYSKRKK
jgi:hypothetical protein